MMTMMLFMTMLKLSIILWNIVCYIMWSKRNMWVIEECYTWEYLLDELHDSVGGSNSVVAGGDAI